MQIDTTYNLPAKRPWLLHGRTAGSGTTERLWLSAAVATCDHFKEMAVGIGEIEPATAVVAVNFAGAPAGWIGPIVEISLADSTESSPTS